MAAEWRRGWHHNGSWSLRVSPAEFAPQRGERITSLTASTPTGTCHNHSHTRSTRTSCQGVYHRKPHPQSTLPYRHCTHVQFATKPIEGSSKLNPHVPVPPPSKPLRSAPNGQQRTQHSATNCTDAPPLPPTVVYLNNAWPPLPAVRGPAYNHSLSPPRTKHCK